MEKTLILVRGVSGAGKSTLAGIFENLVALLLYYWGLITVLISVIPKARPLTGFSFI